MKAFCCECGAPVPMVQNHGKFVHGVCRKHPEAKRVLETWCQKKFAELREAVDSVTNSPGRVYTGGDTYWSVLESREAGKGITRFGGAR